jgi:hypothetical protein
MKHLLPLTVLSVIVLLGCSVAVLSHRDYTHQLTVKNAQAALHRAKTALKVQVQAQSTAKKLQVANTDIVLLVANCKEGEAAYNMLTISQKQHVRAPYCSYNTVQ